MGTQWADLPERYPPYQTCHRRFQEWVQSAVLQSVLEGLAQDLEERGELDLAESFIDGTFVMAKKGTQPLVYPKGTMRLSGAKVARSWRYRTLLVLASPCTLALLHHMRSSWYTKLSHLDMVYDSDPLDAELAVEGVEMIASHRSNRKKPQTQDSRKLRRYKRRWKIERLFAHLSNFRRLVVRYEFYPQNFLAFLQLGCIKSLLRRFWDGF